MKTILSSFGVGFLFALGLGVSGMTNADKVIAFLNPVGGWDPSLGLVMVGAIGVHLALYKFILKRPSPVFGQRFGIPTRTDIDGRLVGGAALFGLGWGLGGFCPGPGLVSSATGLGTVLVFVATMTGGMLAFHVGDQLVQDWKAAREAARKAAEDRADAQELARIEARAR